MRSRRDKSNSIFTSDGQTGTIRKINRDMRFVLIGLATSPRIERQPPLLSVALHAVGVHSVIPFGWQIREVVKDGADRMHLGGQMPAADVANGDYIFLLVGHVLQYAAL